jgi:hypothetical protein
MCIDQRRLAQSPREQKMWMAAAAVALGGCGIWWVRSRLCRLWGQNRDLMALLLMHIPGTCTSWGCRVSGAGVSCAASGVIITHQPLHWAAALTLTDSSGRDVLIRWVLALVGRRRTEYGSVRLTHTTRHGFSIRLPYPAHDPI